MDEHSTVELDDDVEPDTSPLTQDEADELRTAADPDRLRCEPRGCERWRLPLQGHLGGAAALDDRTVAVIDRVDGHSVGTDPDGPPADTLIQAIDVTDGTLRWEQRLTDLVGDDVPSSGPDAATLAAAPSGALLAAGSTVIALTADGGTRWRWVAPVDGSPWLNQVIGLDDTVLVVQEAADAGTTSRVSVTALEPSDGQVRWDVEGSRAGYLANDLLVTIEDDTLRSREPATGQVRWELEAHAEAIMRPAGPWIVVEQPDATQVVDGEDGSVAADLDGVPLGPGLHHEGSLLVVLADERPQDGEREATELQLVALDQHGATAWSTTLDDVRAEPACCVLRVDEDTVVLVASSEERHRFDLDTGALVAEDDGDPTSPDDGVVGGFSRWPLDDDVTLEQHTERHTTLHAPAGEVDIHGQISGLFLVSELDLLLLGSADDAMAVATE